MICKWPNIPCPWSVASTFLFVNFQRLNCFRYKVEYQFSFAITIWTANIFIIRNVVGFAVKTLIIKVQVHCHTYQSTLSIGCFGGYISLCIERNKLNDIKYNMQIAIIEKIKNFRTIVPSLQKEISFSYLVNSDIS